MSKQDSMAIWAEEALLELELPYCYECDNLRANCICYDESGESEEIDKDA
jgi:hypothetical protein